MQTSLFDYQALDAETRITALKIEEDFHTSYQSGNKHGKKAIDDWSIAGQRANEMRFLLKNKRPGFENWYTSQGVKRSTIYSLIHLSEWIESSPELRELSGSFESLSTLTELASPSTPDEARQEAIDRAAQGEKITSAVVKEITNGHKPAPDNGYNVEADEADDEPPARDWLRTDDPAAEIEAPKTNGDSYARPPNYLRDTQTTRPANEQEPHASDICQTPPYALDPLLPYLPAGATIWEPAAGENLMVEALYDSGFEVIPSDILTGQNFFDYQPESQWDCLVTNPPFSLKFPWLKRCYELGKPFALLLTVNTLGTRQAQELMQQYGFEIMLLNRRVSFKMPNKGWSGKGAHFSTIWFCWHLLPQQMMFGEIVPTTPDVQEE